MLLRCGDVFGCAGIEPVIGLFIDFLGSQKRAPSLARSGRDNLSPGAVPRSTQIEVATAQVGRHDWNWEKKVLCPTIRVGSIIISRFIRRLTFASGAFNKLHRCHPSASI